MATVKQNNEFVQATRVQYPLDEAIDWIQSNLSPEDVFNPDALEAWADRNHYVLSEDPN